MKVHLGVGVCVCVCEGLPTGVDLPVSLQGFLGLELGATLVTNDGLLASWTERKRQIVFIIKVCRIFPYKHVRRLSFSPPFDGHKTAKNEFGHLCEPTP